MFWSRLRNQCMKSYVSCFLLTNCTLYVWTSTIWISIFQIATQRPRLQYWQTTNRAGVVAVSTISSELPCCLLNVQRPSIISWRRDIKSFCENPPWCSSKRSNSTQVILQYGILFHFKTLISRKRCSSLLPLFISLRSFSFSSANNQTN